MATHMPTMGCANQFDIVIHQIQHLHGLLKGPCCLACVRRKCNGFFLGGLAGSCRNHHISQQPISQANIGLTGALLQASLLVFSVMAW